MKIIMRQQSSFKNIKRRDEGPLAVSFFGDLAHHVRH